MKKILLYNGRDWGKNVGHKIALKLISDTDYKVGCITSKDSTNNFIIKKENFIYDYHIFLYDILKDPQKFIDNNLNLVSDRKNFNLGYICRELNIESVWPYTQLLRDYVRNFKEKFYYSFRQGEKDEEIILLIKAMFLLALKIHKEFNPDLMITPNYVSLQHVILDLYFKNKNIKTLSFSSLGLKKIGIFTNSYNDEECNFNKELDKLNEAKITLNNDDEANELMEKTLLDLKNNKIKLKKINLMFFLKRIKYILKRLNKPKLIKNTQTSDTASFFVNTRNLINETFYIKKVNKFNFDKLENLDKFVYLPLQSQPEQTVDSYAPLFNNQIETSRQIAMSLPKDLYLVVKDHPNMFGKRPPTYLEKIQRSPNVKLLNYDVSNYDILKKTRLMIGFSGSTFLEAAMLNIPSILLGNIGTIKKLPNVYCHTDMSSISSKILNILEKDLEKDSQTKLINYFKCAIVNGMDVENYWNLWSLQGGNFDKFYQELIKEIEHN